MWVLHSGYLAGVRAGVLGGIRKDDAATQTCRQTLKGARRNADAKSYYNSPSMTYADAAQPRLACYSPDCCDCSIRLFLGVHTANDDAAMPQQLTPTDR